MNSCFSFSPFLSRQVLWTNLHLIFLMKMFFILQWMCQSKLTCHVIALWFSVFPPCYKLMQKAYFDAVILWRMKKLRWLLSRRWKREAFFQGLQINWCLTEVIPWKEGRTPLWFWSLSIPVGTIMGFWIKGLLKLVSISEYWQLKLTSWAKI